MGGVAVAHVDQYVDPVQHRGVSLYLISDIPGVKYTEGRFLPYFFPDTFHQGGDGQGLNHSGVGVVLLLIQGVVDHVAAPGPGYLQLSSILGVEKETGFTLGYDKYNWEEHPDHFILA